MIKSLAAILIFASLHCISFAQSDTTISYYNLYGTKTTKDSAFYFTKFYPQSDTWQIRKYSVLGNKLEMEGSYGDKEGEQPLGTFKWYKEDGSLDYDVSYENSSPKAKTYYFKSGAKKSVTTYNNKEIADQKGWDETGKEIKNFVVEREARFKGGLEGWRKYLEKHLDINVAANSGAPAGMYTVKLQFIVDKQGYISNVKAISVPQACKPCATEAVQVISNGPKWVPAIQNNENVIYQAIQLVSFQVEETPKKKG